MKYMIGGGYYSKDPGTSLATQMRDAWNANTIKVSPHSIIKLAVGDSLPDASFTCNLTGNLGHIDDLVVAKTKPHKFCGWSGAMLALAMLAYCDEADFIYKEQDCLAFGEWVMGLYAATTPEFDKDDGYKVIFGSCEIQPAAQSLFLVRHEYIPEFVKQYLQAGQDNDEANLPEMKFARLAKEHPKDWRRFEFGFDRDRPKEGLEQFIKDWDGKSPWYIQQVTAEELEILKAAKLV